MSPRALSDYHGFVVFVYSNEGDEPMHVHVCRGKAGGPSVKVWITAHDVELASDDLHLSSADLGKVLRYIRANRAAVIASWVSVGHPGTFKGTSTVNRMRLD